jgi:hypothetical protein
MWVKVVSNTPISLPTNHICSRGSRRRARLALVRELPERPRRFLLRQMLGYSYVKLSRGRARQPDDDQQADRARQAAAARARRTPGASAEGG